MMYISVIVTDFIESDSPLPSYELKNLGVVYFMKDLFRLYIEYSSLFFTQPSKTLPNYVKLSF